MSRAVVGLGVVVGVVSLAFVGAAIFFLPPYLVTPIEDEAAYVGALSAARTLVAQVSGGFLVSVVGVITLYWTARRSVALERQIEIARHGQVTERLSRAIDQIGATHSSGLPNVEVRAGGLTVLGRIAAEEPSEKATVLSLTTGYLRSHLHIPWPSDERFIEFFGGQEWDWFDDSRISSLAEVLWRPDVTGAMGVFGQLIVDANGVDDGVRLDEIFLPRFIGTGGKFRGVSFSWSWLLSSNFDGADLHEADLSSVRCDYASFRDANLTEVIGKAGRFSNVDFSSADLTRSNFERATLWSANFAGAIVFDVDFSGANLRSANFEGALVANVNFHGADLRDVKGLDASLIEVRP